MTEILFTVTPVSDSEQKKCYQAIYFLEYSVTLGIFQIRNFRDKPVWKSGNIMEMEIFFTSKLVLQISKF